MILRKEVHLNGYGEYLIMIVFAIRAVDCKVLSIFQMVKG